MEELAGLIEQVYSRMIIVTHIRHQSEIDSFKAFQLVGKNCGVVDGCQEFLEVRDGQWSRKGLVGHGVG